MQKNQCHDRKKTDLLCKNSQVVHVQLCNTDTGVARQRPYNTGVAIRVDIQSIVEILKMAVLLTNDLASKLHLWYRKAPDLAMGDQCCCRRNDRSRTLSCYFLFTVR